MQNYDVPGTIWKIGEKKGVKKGHQALQCRTRRLQKKFEKVSKYFD